MKKAIAENSSRSESTSETATTASTSSQGRRYSRKRKRVDTENSTCSKTSDTNEASSLIDNCSNRDSPELGCSICLGTVENRAFTDACYHTFCFECLVEWSRVRAVCPLCKKSFHSIIHSFKSYDDYKLYQVPTSYVSSYVNISSVNNSEPLNLSRFGRFLNSNNLTVPPVDDADRMLALRRRVYTHSEEMQVRGLWSSDGVVISPPHQVSPAMFDCYPVMLERVRPWVLREVAVIIGNGDIQYVAGIVLDLLRHFPITSEDFYARLFPYFGLHTRRFLLELDAFARSPFDMTTYDARVVYSTGANAEASHHSPTEHVEDISSSDDSDIEIVTPAVVTSAEPTLNNIVNTVTDGALHFLQTFQHSLLMSSFMNRRSHHTGLESPVPGPSGLGQAAVPDESDSVDSHAPGSVYNAEERSNSPMVLSDADSDVVVVDIDQPARSPIHISSGEEDNTAQRARTRRRVKRRRRREGACADSVSEFELSDSLMSNADCAAENEVLRGDGALSCDELPATSDKSVETNAENIIQAEEPTINSDHAQNQSLSHSSSVRSNDHSSSSFKLSTSKSFLQLDDGIVADAARQAFHHARPKRSRSANRVSNVPVVSLSSTDDVKPVTCKKHVSGHKSSKQKAREVVAEKRSAEVVGDSAEKPVTGERLEATDGSHDLNDAGSNEQSSADLANEVKAPSIGESSIACADFSGNHSPVRSSAEELISNCELAADRPLDEGVLVPSTSETRPLPSPSSSDHALENVHGSSILTAKVTFDIAQQCSPKQDENLPPCDANACSSWCSVVQVQSVHELSKNAITVAVDCGKINSCENETQTVLSPGCISPGNNNDVICNATEPVHPCVVSFSCANAVIDTCLPSVADRSSPSDSCIKLDHSDCSFEPSYHASMSVASSSSSNSHESCNSKTEGIEISVHKPLQKNASNSCLVTDTASSDNWSLPPSLSGTEFDGGELIDFTFAERTGSTSSVFHDMDASPASPSPVVNDSILSPVGLDSSDSDSEVEWLETGVSGRQRCISISSGGSSVVYSPSNHFIWSDTDSLEMLDTEMLLSVASEDPYTASQGQTRGEELPHVNSATLPLASDVASCVDIDQAENAVNSEQINVEQEAGSREDNDDVAADDSASETSTDITLLINPPADARDGQDSDTDIEDLYS